MAKKSKQSNRRRNPVAKNLNINTPKVFVDRKKEAKIGSGKWGSEEVDDYQSSD